MVAPSNFETACDKALRDQGLMKNEQQLTPDVWSPVQGKECKSLPRLNVVMFNEGQGDTNEGGFPRNGRRIVWIRNPKTKNSREEGKKRGRGERFRRHKLGSGSGEQSVSLLSRERMNI